MRASKQLTRRRLIFLLFLFIVIVFFWEKIFGQNEEMEILIEPSPIPTKFIPIYKAAEDEFGVPWHLLAAHHRVETIFSTMDPMLSPAGAEGHMQFMPCTFVGWSHPTCEDLGKGNISDEEKMDPEIIQKYGGYGVDANGDGVADPWNIEDAVFSAANYLADHGAADGEIAKAVYAYNHSEKYVEDVLYYYNLFKEFDSGDPSLQH